MKHKDIHFDAKTTHKILKNLCVTLKANNIDYTCGFMSDYIYGIKCNKYIIDTPTIKSTSLLYKVTEDNGITWGLFDIKYLLKFLRENCKKHDDHNPTPYEKGTTDLIEKGWKMKEELKAWRDAYNEYYDHS